MSDRVRRSHGALWTPTDDDQLLAGVTAGVPRAELAKQIGRSLSALNTRLRKLRLAAKGQGRLPDPTYNRRVDAKEDAILLEMYEDKSIHVDEIAALIGRSRASVYRQAAQLGLTRHLTPEERRKRLREERRISREKKQAEKDAFKKGVKHDPTGKGERNLSSNPWINI